MKVNCNLLGSPVFSLAQNAPNSAEFIFPSPKVLWLKTIYLFVFSIYNFQFPGTSSSYISASGTNPTISSENNPTSNGLGAR